MVVLATSSHSIVPCAVDDGKGRRDERRRVVLRVSAAGGASGQARERLRRPAGRAEAALPGQRPSTR